MRRLEVAREQWPIRGGFRISRGEKREADVVVVTLHEDGVRGRGECVPYPHFGETVDAVLNAIEELRESLEAGLEREELQSTLPPGAARNAIDCSLWDLAAKQSGTPVWRLAGLAPPQPLKTALTISVDTPERMAAAAAEAHLYPLLKLKLDGGADDLARIEAVHAAAGHARLILDPNESWSAERVETLGPSLSALNVVLLEQPVPAGAESALGDIRSAVPLCADESVHDLAGLEDLADCYDFVNIKLDKTGGLTEALRVARRAQHRGVGLMVGCMVGTSLAMAPAILIGQIATFVDLDGPLLLEKDRVPGLRYDPDGTLHPGPDTLWG